MLKGYTGMYTLVSQTTHFLCKVEFLTTTCIYNIIFICGVLKCLFVVLKLCLQTLAKKQDIFRISV